MLCTLSFEAKFSHQLHMKSWILNVLILCTTTVAYSQVDLYIEDVTGKKFLLGIDGYVQNTEAVSKLVIKKLDTSDHQLQLKTIGDALLIKRKLALTNEGLHHYVLTTNYMGKLQLRYRGIIRAAPQGIITMNQQKVLPLKHEPVVSIAAADVPKPKLEKPTTAEKPSPEQVKEDVTLAAISTPKPKVENNKPISVKEPTTSPKEPEPIVVEISPVEQAIKNMQEATFAFDKIAAAKKGLNGASITTNDVETLLKEVNYDQVKIELIYQLKSQVSDKDKLKELGKLLTFDYSKQLLEKRLRDE